MHPAFKVLAVTLSLATLGALVWQGQQKPQGTKGKNNLKRMGLMVNTYYSDGDGTFMPAVASGQMVPQVKSDSDWHPPLRIPPVPTIEPKFFSSSKAPSSNDGVESIDDPPPSLFSSSKVASITRKQLTAATLATAHDLYDQGKYREALKELESILPVAKANQITSVEPANTEALALRQLCRDKLAPRQEAPHP